MEEFIAQLASGAPTPGGGGASAVIGCIGAALCSMVANLTSGKKKYESAQAQIEAALARAGQSMQALLELSRKDAEAFTRLREAYAAPKGDPARSAAIERALAGACSVPLEMMEEIERIAGVLGTLEEKGSRLAVSDVGVAAAALRSAAEGAALNVYANTKLMKDRQSAIQANARAEAALSAVVPACERAYRKVKEGLVAGRGDQ